jgi:putative membrane protein
MKLIWPLLTISFIGLASQAQTSTPDSTAPATVQATAPTAHQPSMSDNQIVKIMKTANEAEIDAAKLAQKKAVSQGVKDFAEHMVVEHKQNMTDGKDLAKKIDLNPENTEAAKQLKKQAQNQMDDLKKKKGSDFEKAYIEQQLAMHKQLLNDLDQKFIPSAHNPQFKEFLQKTRAHVQEHISKAETLETSLNK